MSEVKRYWIHWNDQLYVEDKNGDLVMAEDFDRVTAERDAERRRADVAVADANAADAAGNKVSELLSNRTAERDALQALLTAADERADVLTKALSEAERVLGCYAPPTHNVLDLISAALKPAEGGGDE